MRWHIVIPIYNEVLRLGKFFTKSVIFLSDSLLVNEVGEITFYIVDDGSTDGSAQFIESHPVFKSNAHHYKLIRSSPNRGKGYATRLGFRQAQEADIVGFMDCDLSTPLHHLCDVASVLRVDPTVQAVFGERSQNTSHYIKQHRRWLSGVLSCFSRFLLGHSLRDTQIGFKFFRFQAIQEVLPYMAIDSYAFDLELIVLLRQFNLSIGTTPVGWHEDPHSKVNCLKDGWRILSDLFIINQKRMSVRLEPVSVLKNRQVM